jgi:hypothetical protein
MNCSELCPRRTSGIIITGSKGSSDPRFVDCNRPPCIFPFSMVFKKSRVTERLVFSAFSHFAELFQNISLVVFRVFLERPIGMSRFPESYAVFSEIVFPDFRFVWSMWGCLCGWWKWIVDSSWGEFCEFSRFCPKSPSGNGLQFSDAHFFGPQISKISLFLVNCTYRTPRWLVTCD